MDALQWMGAVRMRVQTADKNITIIHTTPVHQLTSWEDKSWNKSSIKTFLTSNCCFWLKYESLINNNAFSIEKVVWSESGEKYAQIKHRLQAKEIHSQICLDWFWTVLACKQCLMCAYFSPDSDETLEEALLWIIIILSSQDVNLWTGVVWITCGLLWCFYQLFGLSFWRHHSLQSIHWWDTDAMLHFSKSDEETYAPVSCMAWEWVRFQLIFIFGWTIPLNRLQLCQPKLTTEVTLGSATSSFLIKSHL